VAIIAAALVVLFRPGLPASVPRQAHRLAFPVLACLFAWELWGTAGLLPAMVRISLWLLPVIRYRMR
jgi:hypothetical protein